MTTEDPDVQKCFQRFGSITPFIEILFCRGNRIKFTDMLQKFILRITVGTEAIILHTRCELILNTVNGTQLTSKKYEKFCKSKIVY